MPRDIPVGNGELLVTFDHHYRIRDLFYPRVGGVNHTDGSVQRFGVWADGSFAWIEDASWKRELRYRPDTLVTEVRLVNESLGLELSCSDAVDHNDAIYLRHMVVRDLKGRAREVRIFLHFDPALGGSALGNTANYDPTTAGVVLYKEDTYLLLNACDQNKCGIDHWAIGAKRVGGAEGTWRDAEDGQLGRNAISQGSIDATIGFNLQVPAGGESYVTAWIACGPSYKTVKELNRRIWEQGPTRLIASTDAYWRLWAKKEEFDTTPLPEPVRDLFYRSMLIMRTQIDNGGAIIAANDSDIAHMAGDHYSYCWPRDGALVAYALVLAGQAELSRAFFRYCAHCVESEGYFLHKYTPAGNLASSWHPWLLDGRRVLPIQQDETSLVIWALRKHFETFKDVEFVKPLYEPLIVKTADWIVSYRDHNGLPEPSWDLWEERRGVHTFTVAATIGALEAAASFAREFGELDRAASYGERAERMRGALRRHLWHSEHERFARMATPLPDGSYRLDMTDDSANFALFAFGALEARDPMVEREMAALRDRLWVKTSVGGCARYTNDYYHQVETEKIDQAPGNPWVICTLWHAQHKIARAETLEELAEAIPYLEWAVGRARRSGVLAEQFHPHTGDPISVSPLTWSHATVLVACVEYMRKHEALAGRRKTDRVGAAPSGSDAGAMSG